MRPADCCRRDLFGQLARRGKEALSGAPARGPPAEPVFDAPLDVVWGSRPDPDYLALTKAVTGRAAPCRKAADTWRERLVEQMAGIRGAGAGATQECPYTLNIGYDRL